jgi:hypothetical protein
LHFQLVTDWLPHIVPCPLPKRKPNQQAHCRSSCIVHEGFSRTWPVSARRGQPTGRRGSWRFQHKYGMPFPNNLHRSLTK